MEEFENLVDQYYQPLYRFGYSLAKNPDRASDLVQQTFVIWAQKGHQLRDRSKAKTWLFTTLYREYLGTARRSQRHPEMEIGEVEHELPVEEKDSGRQIDAQRKVLDVPIGTVMSRISRGKEQLRKKMASASEVDSSRIVDFKPKNVKQNNG